MMFNESDQLIDLPTTFQSTVDRSTYNIGTTTLDQHPTQRQEAGETCRGEGTEWVV
jgi:hypothetical protein